MEQEPSTLSALAIFVLVGFLFPRWGAWRTAVIGLLIAFTIETSQLYHAPWIDAIRATRLGAMTLGAVFNWPDFLAYIAGVFLGVAVELGVRRVARNNET
jgi:hypothetical protein